MDNGDSGHRIYACTSYGAPKKPGEEMTMNAVPVQTLTNVTFESGSWNETAPYHGIGLRILSKSTRRALSTGYTADDNESFLLFVQTVTGTAGLYLGKDVNVQSAAPAALIVRKTS